MDTIATLDAAGREPDQVARGLAQLVPSWSRQPHRVRWARLAFVQSVPTGIGANK